MIHYYFINIDTYVLLMKQILSTTLNINHIMTSTEKGYSFCFNSWLGLHQLYSNRNVLYLKVATNDSCASLELWLTCSQTAGEAKALCAWVLACGLGGVSCRKFLLDEFQQADEIFSCWPSTILRCSDERGLMLFELPLLFLQLTEG